MVANSAMHDSDNDEVVQELDVYISKALADRLYLLQYPLRPANLSYDEEHCLDARVKPKQHKAGVSVHPLAAGSACRLYIHPWGIVAVSTNAKAMFLSHNNVDRPEPCVSGFLWLVGTSGNVKSGKFRNTSPVVLLTSAVRCSFSVFKVLAQSVLRVISYDNVAVNERHDQVTCREAQLPRTEFSARNSVSFLPKTSDRELSDLSRAHSLLLSQSRDFRHLSPPPYFFFLPSLIDKLVPGTQGRTSVEKTAASVMAHLTSEIPQNLRSREMQFQGHRIDGASVPVCSLLLRNFKRFQQVSSLSVVLGCKSVNGDVLYPKDSFSAVTGVPAETMCRARDYLMWLYTQSRHVVQSKFADTVRLPSEDVKTLLSEMGRLTPSGWEFLLSPDKEFVTRWRSRHDSTASEGSGSETPTSHPKSGANDKADFDLSRVKREPQSPSSKSKAAKADKGLTSPVKPSSNSTH
ncbi:unnamed protein product [Ixodes pacificus]